MNISGINAIGFICILGAITRTKKVTTLMIDYIGKLDLDMDDANEFADMDYLLFLMKEMKKTHFPELEDRIAKEHKRKGTKVINVRLLMPILASDGYVENTGDYWNITGQGLRFKGYLKEQLKDALEDYEIKKKKEEIERESAHSFEIRKDLISIENELNRAILIANRLRELDEDWVHNKHNEDMDKIYHLDITDYSTLDQVYSRGRSMGRSLSYALYSFNNIEEHSTVYSWVKYLEEKWIPSVDDYEKVISDAEAVMDKVDYKYNSISQMIDTFRTQIKMLKQVDVLLTIIKGTTLYLTEEKAINKTIPPEISEQKINNEMYDVFISHASEDKKSFVEPLCERLENEKIKLWYDKNEILWGDSIVRKINQGQSKPISSKASAPCSRPLPTPV